MKTICISTILSNQYKTPLTRNLLCLFKKKFRAYNNIEPDYFQPHLHNTIWSKLSINNYINQLINQKGEIYRLDKNKVYSTYSNTMFRKNINKLKDYFGI